MSLRNELVDTPESPAVGDTETTSTLTNGDVDMSEASMARNSGITKEKFWTINNSHMLIAQYNTWYQQIVITLQKSTNWQHLGMKNFEEIAEADTLFPGFLLVYFSGKAGTSKTI